MDGEHEIVTLARLARQGQKDAKNGLARLAEAGLSTYIYRITLDKDLTEDLCQEVLAEMFAELDNLKDVKKIRGWMYKIANTKILRYRMKKRRKAAISASVFYRDLLAEHHDHKQQDGLHRLLRQELSKTIMIAMRELEDNYRAVLTLRFYEQLKFADVAVAMQCSELGARMMFFRAKNALRKKLSRHGLSKSLMLMCLGLFGKITAPAEAAGEVTVSAASAKVGIGAAIATIVSTKIGISTIAATVVAIASVGGVKALSGPSLPDRSQITSFEFATQLQNSTGGAISSLSAGLFDHKFYFPNGYDGPLFTRTVRWNPHRSLELCSWLQNDQANYYYYAGEQKVYINNYRSWGGNFRVSRLPTDSHGFTEFLSEVEGISKSIDYKRDRRTGLIVNSVDKRFVDVPNFKADYRYNHLDADIFEYNWPQDVLVVDERDRMHVRGWTYFTVKGTLGGRKVYGYGQIPFVYSSMKERPPWLVLSIGDDLRIIDCNQGSCIIRSDDTIVESYPSGSFFTGLSQPWMGLHTIDILRRNAVKERIWFDTALARSYEDALITMLCDDNRRRADMVYVVDLEKDIVKGIRIRINARQAGSLKFNYHQDIESGNDIFTEPLLPVDDGGKTAQPLGITWLIDLAEGKI